jgi:hypothetical protein
MYFTYLFLLVKNKRQFISPDGFSTLKKYLIFSKQPNFSTGLAGKFCQELVTLAETRTNDLVSILSLGGTDKAKQKLKG